MKTNKKISFKIFVPMFVLFTISIVLIILIIQLISKNRLNQNFDETLKGKTENLNQIMQKYIQNAKSTLDWFENSPRLLKLFNDKNRNEALKLGQNAMKSFNLDYMVITDTEGNVFIRAHEPDAFGDNIGNQKNIQNAIKGIKSSGIEYGKKVGFSVRAGTPLKDSTGKIIACLSTGYVFSNARFVNLIKDELDADVAIFSGNEKQYSTINTNANAKINNEIILSQVLKGGKNSFIEEDYEGIHYKSGYVPIIDVQGNIAGMMSCSLNSDFISEMKNSLSLYTGSLITFIIFLVFLFLAFILNNSVIKPIQLLAKTNENIANGDLTVKINLNQEDEIGMLGKSMQNMAEKLKHIINDIIGNADNIAAASMQMSSASQELSQGASEQASAAEEVSASMEEMTANIQQTTHNSQQTEKISNKAAEGMRKVNTASKESLDSVKQIALKISIVNEIAFQTNILALNAAVEAARAGEHGKGFAVVAAEVRKLAERSKVAANEIDALSNSSVKVTDESNKFLADLIPEIEKTSKLIQEITAASVEQSSGADQVNNAIQQLNQVTQQNAAASEEMATSSEELAAQAQQLKDVVSYFKVK